MPFPMRLGARTGFYGTLLLLTACPACEKGATSLGPPATDVTVDRLVTNAPTAAGRSSIEIYFTGTGSFTVTAVDPQGQPVPNSQNGIVVDVLDTAEIISYEIVDEPDPDNAVIRVIVHPIAAYYPLDFFSGENLVSIRFVNPDQSEAAASVSVGIHNDIVRLELVPAGPLTVGVDQETALVLRALDAQNRPVPGAEPYIAVTSTNTLIDSAFELDLDRAGAADGIIEALVTGLKIASGSATFSLRGDSRVDPVTLMVHVVDATQGSVVASSPTAQAIPGGDIVLRALVFDAAGNSFPAGEAQVQATSSNPAVATIQGRSEGTPDGIVEFTVRGASAGTAEIRYTYPGAPMAVTQLTVVNAPAGRVVSVASGAEVHVGQTIELLARVRDVTTGALVPGSDPFITARPANAGATVLSKSEGTPGDGEVSFTVRGDVVGVTVILYSYPGAADDTTTLTVIP